MGNHLCACFVGSPTADGPRRASEIMLDHDNAARLLEDDAVLKGCLRVHMYIYMYIHIYIYTNIYIFIYEFIAVVAKCSPSEHQDLSACDELRLTLLM